MTRLRLAAFAAVALGCAASAQAADGDDEQTTEKQTSELGPVEVSAERLNAADSTEAGAETGAARVIEREAFSNRITSLADVLGEETGVQIRSTGGMGNPAAISIRGSSSKQVQVYLDGMLLNDPVTGGVDLSLYSLQDIGEIRTYPGSPPARFARAGVGGVVSMTSLEAGGEPETRATVGAGSFGSREAGLFTSGGRDDFSYWLSFNHREADNDFEYENRSDWFNPNDGETTTRRNADFDQDSISGKFGYELGESRRIDALLQWRDSERGIPTIQNFRDNDATLETLSRRLQLHFQDLGAFDGHLHQSHRLVWSNTEEHYRDRRGFIGTGGNRNTRTRTRELGGNSSLSWLQGGHVISGTVDVSRASQKETDYLGTRPRLDRERIQVTTALSHEWTSRSGALATEAVVRQYDVYDDSEQLAANNSVSRIDTHTSYNGWHLGGRYRAVSWLELYANVGRQIRVPTLRERYGERGLFVGNPELEAEEALSYEAGLRLTHARGSLEITGFRRDLDPGIVAIYDARGVGQYVNIAAEVHGVEIEAQYRPLDFWTLSASGTSQDSENDAPNVADRDGKQLPGVYHESLRLASAWELGPFRLAVDYRQDDELFYDAANILPADTRETVGASLSWRRQWRAGETRLNLEVRNATDELYQDFNRFPSPGRSYFVNLQQSF